MNLTWLLALIILVLAVAYLVMRPTGGRGWMLWQLRGNSRGDGRLETFVAEEELKRAESPRDRDLAP